MRKGKIFCIVTVLLFGLMVCGFTGNDTRVYDQGDLFTEAQEHSLEKLIDRVSNEEEMDLVIVTTLDAKGKQAYQYAEWFYYDAGYDFGYEDTDRGTLYLIDLDNREIYVYCSEDATEYVSDSEIEDVLDVTYPYAADGRYYESAVAFVENMPDYTGKSLVPVIIGIVISFVISGVVVLILLRAQKTSVNVPYTTYVRENSTRVYRQENQFLHTTVVTRKIESDSSRSGGGSGGGHSRGSGGGRSL